MSFGNAGVAFCDADTQGTDQMYTIIEVAQEDLHPAKHQPKDRVKQDASLNRLRNSIRDERLQYPPLVVHDPEGGFIIIDGNRRIAATQMLGWPKVPVIVSQGHPDELFSAVSGNTKPLTSHQWLEIHLAGGEIPSGPNKGCITRLTDVMGREFLVGLAEANISPQIWNLAGRVMRYLSLPENKKPDVLRWLSTNKITRQVSSWISGANSADKLRDAFAENREPTHTLRKAA